MPDRIDKKTLEQINPYESYRVEGTRQAKDDDESSGQQPDTDEEQAKGDAFGRDSESKRYTSLTSQASKNKNSRTVALEDIKMAWFKDVDLKTDPSELVLRVKTFDDDRVFLIKTAISRAQALSLKSMQAEQELNLAECFSDPKIWVEVLGVEAGADDEVTRVSLSPGDTTLSQTFKMPVAQNVWQRLGLLDENKKINWEISLAYVTALGVLFFLVVGGLYLLV